MAKKSVKAQDIDVNAKVELSRRERYSLASSSILCANEVMFLQRRTGEAKIS